MSVRRLDTALQQLGGSEGDGEGKACKGSGNDSVPDAGASVLLRLLHAGSFTRLLAARGASSTRGWGLQLMPRRTRQGRSGLGRCPSLCFKLALGGLVDAIVDACGARWTYGVFLPTPPLAQTAPPQQAILPVSSGIPTRGPAAPLYKARTPPRFSRAAAHSHEVRKAPRAACMFTLHVSKGWPTTTHATPPSAPAALSTAKVSMHGTAHAWRPGVAVKCRQSAGSATPPTSHRRAASLLPGHRDCQSPPDAGDAGARPRRRPAHARTIFIPGRAPRNQAVERAAGLMW
eukprot:scaffold50_cov420-Prasinococcus_capsulatus_cf.AAC.29